MVKERPLTRAPVLLEGTALADNVGLIKENRVLLNRIVESLELLTENEAETGLRWGMPSLEMVLAPTAATVNSETETTWENPPFKLYVILICHDRADGKTLTTAKTVMVTKDGRIGVLRTKLENRETPIITPMVVTITLDEHRSLTANSSNQKATVVVGDYGEIYECQGVRHGPLRTRVELLREVVAALPEE